jgi:hypothetical protein
MLRQLRRRSLPIEPFQQKRDADADENERPNPTCVEVDYAHSREQEQDATNHLDKVCGWDGYFDCSARCTFLPLAARAVQGLSVRVN